MPDKKIEKPLRTTDERLDSIEETIVSIEETIVSNQKKNDERFVSIEAEMREMRVEQEKMRVEQEKMRVQQENFGVRLDEFGVTLDDVCVALEGTQRDVRHLRVLQEETDRNVRIIAEGHANILDKLDELFYHFAPKSDVEVLKSVAIEHSRDIQFLKSRL